MGNPHTWGRVGRGEGTRGGGKGGVRVGGWEGREGKGGGGEGWRRWRGKDIEKVI